MTDNNALGKKLLVRKIKKIEVARNPYKTKEVFNKGFLHSKVIPRHVRYRV